ncbi:hypothetical protein EDB85DRAFT_2159196 [Lactarius pseudohatsudake]|nr:hypothetical protein EDB85DRAFT_2159196 [Lactarius pseudohatsudake]
MRGKRAYQRLPHLPPIVSARAVPAPSPTPICAQWRRRTGTSPLSAPVPVHAEQETQTPPSPLLTRERGLRKKKGHAPPFARNGGATGIPPSLIREQDTRDKPPQPPLPFARKGSAGTRCGMGQDTRRGTAWGKARATPLPPSHWGPRAQRQRGRDGLPPGLRAEATRKRGARGATRTGTPPHP